MEGIQTAVRKKETFRWQLSFHIQFYCSWKSAIFTTQVNM